MHKQGNAIQPSLPNDNTAHIIIVNRQKIKVQSIIPRNNFFQLSLSLFERPALIDPVCYPVPQRILTFARQRSIFRAHATALQLVPHSAIKVRFFLWLTYTQH